MKSPMCFVVVAFIFSLICFPAACSSIHAHHQDFVHCLSRKLRNNNATSQVVYTPNSPSFLPILNLSAQNSRFTGPGTPKPVVIITPLRESHVRAALICSRKYNIQLRTRSGGHDYEGLSFVSTLPFAILDLIKFRSIKVNVGEKSAWVQTGATLGELYYTIGNKSDTLAFPAGICPTVGTGGHISGGGYGMLLRKYGLAADHVIDARIMDVNGRILDRKSMGEDLFWAIRGGGGASFGIILAWKLELVPVPETVTVFNISKTLEQNLTNLLYKWQFFANKADRNLYLRVVLQNTNTTNGERTVEGLFNAQYLGRSEALLAMMQKGFPELGVTKSDLTEMSWINTVTYHYPVDSLLNRSFNLKQRSFKIKSDYAKRPFTPQIFQGMLELFKEEDINGPNMQLVPYGGIMDEISPSETPYPHRAGNLFFLGYATGWDEVGQVAAQKHLSWIRKLYDYLTPYVSNNPRESYSNYRDLDLGQNNLVGTTSLAQASSWGYKYFMNNFYRLAKVKALVDPDNFFRSEQSIIPLSYPL
ncbi:tetrahydrocannabinolic acid synthase-like isoform X2 [Ipomoea triloba]|uniref:tetrahydrocannabinolic acid synthase-like isoform X1 n=1 Tax=Ipomoea triloba TaxID=35885 RepID=UPI00125DCF08|nr:tetrahydrocannabinolic acid synthase-like isoform X1 [Ipomoea triloba]XP_031126502.1 tetrahydrocannabinolic acid synthase-like isoform X2 [Ipomoea triloba]